MGGELGPLHRFDLIGEGFLPYELWLDEKRRLVMAATFAVAWILTENA